VDPPTPGDKVEVRLNAAQKLGNMGADAVSAIPDLVKAMKTDKEKNVRAYCIRAVQAMGSKASAIPASSPC